MYKKSTFINKLLPAVIISIAAILLSAYFAVPNVNIPAPTEHVVSVSYLAPESPLSSVKSHKFVVESYKNLSAGNMLVASEKIKDPRFARTIILLVNYGRQGAAGLIINKSTDTKLHYVLPKVKGLQKSNDNLYFGGPVSMSQITMVIQSSSKPENSTKVFDNIYISSSLKVLEQILENRKPDQRFRLYAGYAGWGPGQLESEIARNDWRVMKGDPDILFNKEDDIWHKLVPNNMSI